MEFGGDFALELGDGFEGVGLLVGVFAEAAEAAVAALVLGAPPPLELLLVGGRAVVERDRVVTVDEQQVADAARRASASLAG